MDDPSAPLANGSSMMRGENSLIFLTRRLGSESTLAYHERPRKIAAYGSRHCCALPHD